MSDIYCDIETVPGQDESAKEQIAKEIEKAVASIKVPGSYSKPESIKGYIAAETDKILATADERYLNTSFNGDLGEIASIAFAVDDMAVACKVRKQGESEAELLDWFWGALVLCLQSVSGRPNSQYSDHVWIGHKLRTFDLPFIYKRSVILGCKPSIYLPHDVGPSSRAVFDTMEKWAGFNRMISQDRLCELLGLTGKDEGITGADVYRVWSDGEYELIEAYNKGDVERCRLIHKRMTFK